MSMPLHYGSVFDEVEAAASRAGVMDLSHLGRIRLRGDGALELLERVCTHDVARQEDDTAAVTLLLDERGGIIDECVLLRLESFWVLTTNAMNLDKVLTHLNRQGVDGVRVDDQSARTAHLLACGPAARDILQAVLPIKVGGLGRGEARMGSLMIASYIAARAGATSHWALEVMLPSNLIGQAWAYITARAGSNCIPPVGLGALDILRHEAGLCRYGCETSQAIDPVTAGLTARLADRDDFIGAEAVAQLRQAGPARRRVQIERVGLTEPPTTLPRQGDDVTDADGRVLGQITSATWSPSRETVLAQAVLAAAAVEVGCAVQLGPDAPARVARVFA